MSKLIVSVNWLQDNLDNPNLIVLDASQEKTASGDVSNFKNLQIKGARFFDIKNVFSDQNSEYLNTLPSAQEFETECQKLGIHQSSIIVVYDNLGIYYSPRVWWMFNTMGHKEVFVLDGGLPAWNNAEFKMISVQKQEVKLGDFQSSFKVNNVKDISYMVHNLEQKTAIVIDARSSDRFLGVRKEPRLNSKSGHIPNSINIHYKSVLTDGHFKPTNELSAIFNRDEISDKPMVFTCGSGITACIVLLASEILLTNSKSIYDGSWNQWSQTSDVPADK